MSIKLTDKGKIRIANSDDVYQIMQRILLRDNKIDREKEHFWIIGLNRANYILYIELVSLGSVKATIVEPMNVFRIAIQKGATDVIAVHNHPSGGLKPSDGDKDLTDRLIQVGKIIDICVTDHLIISTTSYMSFKELGVMAELEQSIKYVPPYILAEKIKEEEKKIREDALKAERDLRKEEKRLRLEAQKRLSLAISTLLDKQMTIEQIAELLSLTPKEVQQIVNKLKKDEGK